MNVSTHGIVSVLAALSAGSILAAGGPLDRMGNVTLKGRLGERLDKMIASHVVATDTDYITAPFLEKTERRQWWQTEFWGKYMHSAMPYLKYADSAKLKASVDRSIARMLASQEPCGYIGNYPDELRCGDGWDVWGMKYTMLGLLHYYDGTKDAKVLEACRRLCDYVIAEIGPGGKRKREVWQTGNYCGLASCSILEPVVWLYNRTKDKKYLDFAAHLVKGMTEEGGGPRLLDALKGLSVADRNHHAGYVEGKWNRRKAYEMMSCYQGLLEYYEVTGQKNLLEAAVATGNQIITNEVNLAGGCASTELWFNGASKQHLPYTHLQETCVTTTWMRFCEKLLEVTGDPKWADQIERSFYNAYLGSLKPDGTEFASYTPLSGSRYHGQHHCYMHSNCCTANGPRGFLCFLKELFYVKGNEMVFNFYTSALVKDTLPNGKKVAFDMYSLYPHGDRVRIVSHTEGCGKVPLKLRIPGTLGGGNAVWLNGKQVQGVKVGSYVTIDHEWKLGDIVEMTFDMSVMAHTLPKDKPEYVAFTRGPVLLARDNRLDKGDQMEPFRRDGIRAGWRGGFLTVRAPSDDIWMTFNAVLPIGAHHENPEGYHWSALMFCDYASAGNTWNRDNYYRTWFPIERAIWE